jgi:hypothetical protein
MSRDFGMRIKAITRCIRVRKRAAAWERNDTGALQ